jgi:hypothetical protein
MQQEWNCLLQNIVIITIFVLWIDVVKYGRFRNQSKGNQVIQSSNKLKNNYFFWVIQELSDKHNQHELGNGLLSDFYAYFLDALETS